MTCTHQRKSEWFELSDEELDYHVGQYGVTRRATIAFCDWLEKEGILEPERGERILDLGAGAGANTHYMARRYPAKSVVGVELNPALVELGVQCAAESGVDNFELVQGDLYELVASPFGGCGGVVSFQTLSWLPEWEVPVRKMAGLGPRWIAVTSLFFEGEVEYRIEVRDYKRPKAGKAYEDSYCNVYSIPRLRKLLAEMGYSDFRFTPFAIDIDLPKPDGLRFGTYTESLVGGGRLQISGALLMPWYFVVARKAKS